ncbi:hypothetical protein C343_01229 [Cryptococcus neoformans C23]|nr:hypothetical protein C347_01300 [Cryptococcus neoformans var. grubii AD2-60a]OWZ46834.1 hypothetical protein C343_01229 [Cryptococcus neoformans var. grubii C23]OXC86327.1 hypothetical protein C344_01237 [Cryptococcus neoformans var. grubii AD1-7a]OXG85823.1 hypothetical protein C350_01233 [Cryptococcus neoformans var. grubii MW-RSA36]OXH37619.1 hypothetical protein J005_01239 [Cryptococcus neoformans var. grubii]OXL10306.1 hypothetical protein C348_01209 [Cryptococcus neoformans var. grubi
MLKFAQSMDGTTPLPITQIVVLMIVRLAEPISYTVIFPFINQMVEELQVTDNPDRVGFYSGLVESVFAFVQFFTVYHWAQLSDRIGRKPVLLLGLTGVAISGSLFGLANSFWTMIFFRSLSGALNGNVAVVKAAIGDITDESNSTEAFAMYGLTWTMGSMIGNAMGGLLSHPFERFPRWFGSVYLFQNYPYLLPCLVGAGLTVLGILFSLLFYRESLPGLTIPPISLSSSFFIDSGLSRRLSWALPSSFIRTSHHERQVSTASLMSETETLVDSDTRDFLALRKGIELVDENVEQAKVTRWGFWELMRFKKVKIMTATVFLNAFVQGAWNAAVLLFLFDRNHGLGMSVSKFSRELMYFEQVRISLMTILPLQASAIGIAMAINGIWTIACQVLFLNRLRRLLGVSLSYKLLSLGWPLVWFFMPLLRNVLTSTESPVPPLQDVPDTKTSHHRYHPVIYPEERAWPTTICVNLYLMFATVVAMSSSLLMVLVNYASPDKTALGAINGIGTAAGCMARVIGPSSVSALFAFSMDGQVMGGRLWWIFMVGMSLVNFGICTLVAPDSNGNHGDVADEFDEEMELGSGTSERVGTE